MGLYFFVNHILRKFVDKTSPDDKNLYDIDSLDKKEIDIIKKSIKIKYSCYSNLKTSKEIYKELSRLILEESFNKKSKECEYLYNELLYLNRKLNKIVNKNNLNLNKQNTRYLFILIRHYFLSNHLLKVLNDLMKNQLFFLSDINRILKYPQFKEWVSMKTYLTNHSNNCLVESKEYPYYNTELYQIYIMEIYQSKYLGIIENLIIDIPKRSFLTKYIEIISRKIDRFIFI